MKKTLIIGALTCALLFLVAWLAWRIPRSAQSAASQKTWNSHAIVATFAGIRVREVDATHAAVDFVYDLENHGANDFQLTPGPGVVIMRRLRPDGSLSSDKQLRLVSGAFVPVSNRTRITVELTDSFRWPGRTDTAAEQSFRDFVARKTSGVESFVIFDQASRYEIELPINLTAAQISPAAASK